MKNTFQNSLRPGGVLLFALAFGCASTLTTVITTAAAAAAAAPAKIAPAAYQKLNLQLRDQHIVPGYAKFAKTAARLKQDVDSFCAKTNQPKLNGVRQRFHTAMDAWVGVQHIQFGPVEMFMRHFRLQFWPDRRNLGPKQIRALLAAGRADVLEKQAFQSTSVAVQGFPSMEWLLFSNHAGAALLAGDTEARYRCAVLGAIATNIKSVSDNIQAEWRGAQGFGHLIETAQSGNDQFDNSAEATLEMFKGFYGGLHDIADVKLGRVLGADIKHARGAKAAFRLSNRSLRNIQISLDALQKAYVSPGGFGDFVTENTPDTTLNSDVQDAFAKANHALAEISKPLNIAVTLPEERAKVVALAQAVKHLSQLATTRLSKALGVGVGFNSRDGD